MNRRLLIECLLVSGLAIAAIVFIPEPYTLPATFSIFGAFIVLSLVQALRDVRKELQDVPVAPRGPSTRAERLGLVLAAVWLLPVLVPMVAFSLILLGFDYTSPRFWIAVASVVGGFELLVWAFALPVFRGGRRAG